MISDIKQSENFIDNLQAIVTEYMKLSSYSVGISDLISNKQTNNLITQELNKKKKEVTELIQQLHIDALKMYLENQMKLNLKLK